MLVENSNILHSKQILHLRQTVQITIEVHTKLQNYSVKYLTKMDAILILAFEKKGCKYYLAHISCTIVLTSLVPRLLASNLTRNYNRFWQLT